MFDLPAGFEFGEDLLGDFLQGLEDADALKGHGLDDGLVFLAEFGAQKINRQDVGQVTLVELQDVGNLVEVVAVLFQIRHQVVEGLDIGILALFLRVGDEHDTVDTAQNELAASIVEDLSGNGVEVDSGFEAAHVAQVEGQEVEEEGTLGFRGKGDHLAFLLVRGLLVNDLQVRGLAAQSGTVVHDLAVNLAGCEVDETQAFPQTRGRTPAGASAHNMSLRGLAGFIPYGVGDPQVTCVTPGEETAVHAARADRELLIF